MSPGLEKKFIEFYESDLLDKVVISVCKDTRYNEDLKSELIVILLNMNQNKLRKLLFSGEIIFYSIKIIKNQFYTKNSKFWKNYLNFVSSDDDIINNLESINVENYHSLLDEIETILDEKVDFFSAFLFRKYYYDWWDYDKDKSKKGLSYRKIENEYTLNKDFKIDHMFIWSSVKDTLNIIKKELRIDQK